MHLLKWQRNESMWLELSSKLEIIKHLHKGESTTSIASINSIGWTTVNNTKRDSDKIDKIKHASKWWSLLTVI